MIGTDSVRQVGRDPHSARAQSEVVGVVFLTVVVAALALLVGAAVIAGSTGDDAPTADFVVETTATNVTLTHNGGDNLALSELTVYLEGDGSRQQFTPSPSDTDDGDATLRPGERIEYAHSFGDGDLTVLVVHEPSSTVLFEERTTVPTPSP
jgi:FlaG/FlaF family flagellin (archaellin)